jgi:YggT family protein
MDFGDRNPVGSALELALVVLNLAILGRVLLSFIDPSPFPDTPLKRVLWALTEPILGPLRRWLPPVGMFDLSPLVAILILSVLTRLVENVFGP